MAEFTLSKRKMESYRRAEVVAQAARQYIASGPRASQEMIDALIDSTIELIESHEVFLSSLNLGEPG